MLKPTTSFLALTFVTLVGACGSDPPAPSTVRSRITGDLGYVLHESYAAGDGASKMVPTGSLNLFQKVIGQGGSTAVANLMASTANADEAGFDTDAVIEKLNTTVFTDENEVEPGVYAVPANLACEQTTYDPNGLETTSIDPDCAASWDKIQLRIRVEENGSSLVFAIQIGSGHDEPLEIGLTHNSLSVTVDLDEAEAATVAIASAFGEMAPNAQLGGRVTGKLTVLGAAHASVAFSIDRALDIKVADQGADLAGPDAFRLSSAAAHVLDVELDGNAGVGSVNLGLGATAVHTPGTDNFELDLPGATLQADLAANGPLHINHISLGDRTTTLSRNGAVGLAIDLNPSDGRSFDATITADTTAGTETVEVSPKLDARIMTNHTALGDTAPPYDVTRVLLDGSLRGNDASGQVQVLTGAFSISTNPAQYGFSATAGQCVAGEDTYDAASGDYYTAWTVGACL